MSVDKPLLSPLIETAIELAAEWHDGTYRKRRWREVSVSPPLDEAPQIPVISHVTNVGLILQRAGWEEEIVAAGVLHDVIEDADRFGRRLGYDRLVEMIGEKVADLVLQVSEQKYDEHGTPVKWRPRKEAYIANLREGTDEGIAISLADKMHNLWTMNQGIGQGVDIFKAGTAGRPLSAGPQQQIWLFRSVLEVSYGFSDRRLTPMRDEVIRELQRFERSGDGR